MTSGTRTVFGPATSTCSVAGAPGSPRSEIWNVSRYLRDAERATRERGETCWCARLAASADGAAAASARVRSDAAAASACGRSGAACRTCFQQRRHASRT